MALGLHEAAHHAKRPHRPAALGEKARNDGVVRPLAGGQAVGVLGLQREVVAPVVQANAGARHHHARAKTHVIALDERDHVALAVGSAQVHRAAARRLAGQGQAGALANEGAALVGVAVAEQVGHRDAHVGRVGNVGQAVGKSQLDGLNLPVVGEQVVAVGELKALEDVERHQRHQAVAIGRDFPHVVAPVVGADGLAPIHSVIGQVLGAQVATRRLHKSADLFGQRTTVKALRAGFGNGLQGAGMAFGAPKLTGHGRALGGEGIKPVLEVIVFEMLAEHGRGLLPGKGHRG